MAIDWAPLIDVIRSHDRFLLSSHVRPDADAIGSELGLAYALDSLGKSVRIVNPSEWPATLSFLDPERRCRKLGETMTADEARDTDVHIIMDTSAWGQLQDVGEVFKTSKAAHRAVIDHHVSSDDLGVSVLRDTTAAATGELIFELCEAMGVEVSKPAATALYCAIATDTGWFRFPSTTSRTMRIAGQLIDQGAEPHVLYRLIHEQKSVGRLRLLGRVIGRIEIDCDGRLAYLTVGLQDYKETGAIPADTEDLVNQCLTITGVQAAFIAIQQPNGNVKVSFRSRLEYNVAAVAAEFGGGGHKQAAGATLSGPLADALAKVLPPMQQLVTTDVAGG